MPGKPKENNSKIKTPKKLVGKPKTKAKPKQKTSTPKTNHYFDAIFDNTEFGIAIFQPDGKILKVNKAILNLLGYTEKELNELSVANISYPQEHALTDKLISEILKGKRTQFKVEKRYIAKNGRIIYTSVSVHVAKKINGKITELISILEDLTEKKEILDKLETEQTLLYALLKNIPDSIYFKDRKSRFVKVNKAKAAKHGFASPDELIGKTDFDLYGKEHSTMTFNDEQQIINTNTPLIDIEEKLHFPDGTTRYGSITKMPWYDIQGNVIGTFGVSRDITEKYKSEKLREALFVISETAYTTSDMYDLYQKVHQEVGRLMPAKNFYISLLDEKLNVLSFPYFMDEFDPPQPPKKPGRGLTEYVLRHGAATLVDAQKDLELRNNGEVDLIGALPAIWLGVPLKIAGKTSGAIVVQDYENEKAFGEYEVQILSFVAAQVAQVIERKRTSDEMKKITEELQHLNGTKDKFFSIIAHDLRNPFITILGFSDLLLTDYAELSDEERIFFLEEMRKSAELSHNLLQNLLHWSRSQTGRIEFNQSSLSLKSLVNSNFELLKGSAEKKEIELKSDVSPNTMLFADEDMLNTVLRNLLTNAIKFTPNNGTITVSAIENNSMAEISVTDTGVGMEDSALKNLFRIDVSQSTYGTNKEAGTGLGLILCKEFIEKHGGKISVVSIPGKGSSFTFTIPLNTQSNS